MSERTERIMRLVPEKSHNYSYRDGEIWEPLPTHIETGSFFRSTNFEDLDIAIFHKEFSQLNNNFGEPSNIDDFVNGQHEPSLDILEYINNSDDTDAVLNTTLIAMIMMMTAMKNLC